jgi:hypothetical protein
MVINASCKQSVDIARTVCRILSTQIHQPLGEGSIKEQVTRGVAYTVRASSKNTSHEKTQFGIELVGRSKHLPGELSNIRRGPNTHVFNMSIRPSATLNQRLSEAPERLLPMQFFNAFKESVDTT